MKRVLMLLALVALLGQSPALAQQIQTPKPGSTERTRILDALRPAPGSKIRFIVHQLKVFDGKTARYAYAVVDPSRQEYDGGEFLLRHADGWRVIWSVTGGGTDACRTAADYYQSALRLLEGEGIDPDAISPHMREEHLRLAAFSAEDPDCTALGDLGPDLPATAPEPACPGCDADDPQPALTAGRPRLIRDPRHPAALAEADLDGDGTPDKVSIVHILPGGAGRTIDQDIIIANPWDTDASAQPLADEDTQMGLLIERAGGRARHLLHSPYVELSAALKAGVPVEVKRANSSHARAFRTDCPALRHDFLVMATEAGIDIALFWNANRYDVCWPEEIP